MSVEGCVTSSTTKKFVVGPLLSNFSLMHQNYLIRMPNRTKAVGDKNTVFPVNSFCKFWQTVDSVS